MQRCAQARLVNTGLPVKHLQAKPSTKGEWGDKLIMLTNRLNTGGMMFALIGQRGTGKTQMAAELIRHAVEHEGMECQYRRVMDFFMDIKDTYRDFTNRTEAEVVTSYVKPQLLVLDEVHERGDSPWENRLLTHALDKRYGASKDTLLISNQKPETFGDTIGNSILSRLQETGAIISCEWPSFRAAKNKGES